MSEAQAQPASAEVAQLLVDNHRRFLDFLEPRVASREAAEDLLQSAMARGLERGGELRDAESAVAWFYRLLRNALTDFYRRQATERRAMERHLVDPTTSADVDEALEGELCRCMGALLPLLSDDYAAILRAVDLGGQSPQEFAEASGITPNNSRVRLHRARQALRRELARMCGTCAVHGCLDCSCNATTCSPSAPAKDPP